MIITQSLFKCSRERESQVGLKVVVALCIKLQTPVFYACLFFIFPLLRGVIDIDIIFYILQEIFLLGAFFVCLMIE